MKFIPSLRDRKRYIFFSILSDNRFTYPDMKGAVSNSLENWLGDKGFGKAKIRLIKNLWSQRELSGVIQCSHKSVDDVKVGLALIHQIGDSRVIFRSTRVSGTIKGGR